MADSVNNILQSEFITHQHYIERYKNSEIKRLLSILRQAEKEMRGIILQSPTLSRLSKERQNAILQELIAVQKIYNAEFEEKLIEDMNELGLEEMRYYADEVVQTLNQIEVQITPTILTPEKLESVVRNTAMKFDDNQSMTIRELIREFTNSNIAVVRQTVRNGFLTGQTNKQIVSRLFGSRGRYLRSLNDAQTLTRTMVMHYANTAREQFYQNNTDVIKGYKWLSTLDSRTCFTKGNYVSTPSGDIDISKIAQGDVIYNGNGEEVIVVETLNKKVEELIEIQLEDGKMIRCTPDHYFKLANGRWAEAQYLTEEDELWEK